MNWLDCCAEFLRCAILPNHIHLLRIASHGGHIICKTNKPRANVSLLSAYFLCAALTPDHKCAPHQHRYNLMREAIDRAMAQGCLEMRDLHHALQEQGYVLNIYEGVIL